MAKYGYESHNQECTFALIESFIEDGKLSITKEELEQVSSFDVGHGHESAHTATTIREEYQYGTKVSLENNKYHALLQLAKKILDKTKEQLVE